MPRDLRTERHTAIHLVGTVPAAPSAPPPAAAPAARVGRAIPFPYPAGLHARSTDLSGRTVRPVERAVDALSQHQRQAAALQPMSHAELLNRAHLAGVKRGRTLGDARHWWAGVVFGLALGAGLALVATRVAA